MATIAVGAVALPAPAHAAPVCLSDFVTFSPNRIEVCVDHDTPQVSFEVYVAGEHVASGWATLNPPNDTQVYVYNDTTVVSVSAGIATDEVTGERSLVVCVALAAGILITPVQECRSRRLP